MTPSEDLAHVIFGALSDPNRTEDDLEIIEAILRRWGVQWTSDKPVVAGWYWWRPNREKEAFILHLGMSVLDFDGPEVLCTDYCEDQETPEDLDGEWAGPLTPPEESI
jgi:hypothetical protein